MKFETANNVEIKEEIVFRSNKDGTVVVMKMDNDDMFYKITGVAAEMWQSFSEKNNNLGDVTGILAKNYSTSSDEIIKDAQDFLNKILELDLVKVS